MSDWMLVVWCYGDVEMNLMGQAWDLLNPGQLLWSSQFRRLDRVGEVVAVGGVVVLLPRMGDNRI